MQTYKLYFLDRNEVAITMRQFEGSDDQAALDEGEKLSRTHAIEIWHDDRRVGHLQKQSAPAASPFPPKARRRKA